MPYEDIPIAHVLNYLLADGFDAREDTTQDWHRWLGSGKTLADMLGAEASANFYTPQRRQEIAGFIRAFDLEELQSWLNNQEPAPAVILRLNAAREFVFAAGDPASTPAFMTDWFKVGRARVVG